tara:strand:- start:18 stop:635 length:618 start_codon:yes stop_codon:yes gene_type:complete
MVKGYDHNIYNNTAFDNTTKNDIIIMIEQGGNEGTITINNAANKIAGHRTGSYDLYPVPGVYENNWNGYETGLDIKDFLINVENYDFRPMENSELIDAGLLYDGLDISYNGENPDIGAYEFDGEYWIPGITWNLEEEFGEQFTFPNDLVISLGDVNYDGIINILDIIGLIDIILNEEPYNENGDMNGDGGINILDITRLVNIILN